MFGLASAIIVYSIRISWTCAIYREQQPSADCAGKACLFIGRVSLARENEAGDNWGQEVQILHVNV